MESLKSVKLYEQVAIKVKEMIISGQFQKGDLLPSEKKLIEIMGVSRITVREALKSLTEVGIITTKKGKGSIVLLDKNDLIWEEDNREVYEKYKTNFLLATETRLLLEPGFAREAALLATEEDITLLNEILLGSHVDNQNNFHLTIVKILKNPLVEEIFKNVCDMEKLEFPMTLVPPNKQKTVAEEIDKQHRDIFHAIKSKNSEFAYFYMKVHLTYLKEMYDKYFDNFME